MPGAAPADSIDRPGEGPLEITADHLEYDGEHELYIAAGRVRVVQGDRTLDADWAAFSSQTNLGVASGHVRVVRDGDVLQADFFEFEVDTLEGVVFGADLDVGSNNFLITARELAKTGPDTYRLRDGTFTTCRCPDDGRLPWKLRARKGEFEIGGYAKTRNTTVDVLGVPALWLPWAIFPIKTERTSGLLFPEFSFGGTNGFEFGVPVFWAAHDQLNVILTPSYLSKRGFKADLGFEYVLGERSSGRLYGSFIHDTEVADAPLNRRLFSPNRWAAVWNHDQYLPGDWRFKADVKLVSDNLYTTDFDDLERYRNYRYVESSLFAFNHFGSDGRFGATGAVRWADDQQAADQIDRDPFLLQRLPDIALDVLPGSTPLLGGLVTSMGTDYTYFTSRKEADEYLGVRGQGVFVDVGFDALPDSREIGSGADPYDDNQRASPFVFPDGNGLFDEGEPLNDRGHRFSLHPRIAYPVRLLDRFELHPEVGYYETLYSTADDGFSQRGLVTARVDLKTRLAGTLDLRITEPVRHLMEPRVSWTYVQDREASQLDTPFFVPPTRVPQEFLRQMEPENIVLDTADFIPKANLLTFGFANRFYRKDRKGLERLVADVTVSAGYDFARKNWARFNVDGATFPLRGVRTRFMLSVDPGKARIEEGLMEASTSLPTFRWFRGGAVGLGYRFRRELPFFYDNRAGLPLTYDPNPDINEVSQIGAFTRLRLGPRWMLSYAFSYSLAGNILLQNRGGVSYTSKCKCWQVAVEVLQDRVRDVQFRVGFSLLGLGDGSSTTNPLFR